MSGYNVNPMIKVFVGNNWFAIKSALDKEIDVFLSKNSDINIERFYGPEAEYNDVSTSLSSVSLFSENKMVIIEKLSTYKDVTENLTDFLDKVDNQTSLIIIEPNIDKRSTYYKNLKKLDGFSEFNELEENHLCNWIQKFVAEKSGEISFNDARYLVFRVGNNQGNIEKELTKLLQYDKKITKYSIDLQTNQTPNSTIFSLVETAFSGDVKKALKLYEEQRSLKIEPQAIFGMLVWQMHIVAICVSAGTKNATEISNDTGISSYVIGKSKTIADRMGRAKVVEYLDLLAEIEATSRRQTYNFDDAMKLAITKLAY